MLSRYLLFIASFVLGVIALQQQASLPPWWWAAVSACLALVLLQARHCVIQWIAIALLAFSLGFAWAHWRAEIRMAQRIPSNLVGQTLWVTGYISDLPQASRFGPRFVFTPEAPIANGWLPQRIQVNASDKYGPFLAGERWRLQLKFKPIHGSVNPAGFDLESWFLQHNIAASQYNDGTTDSGNKNSRHNIMYANNILVTETDATSSSTPIIMFYIDRMLQMASCPGFCRENNNSTSSRSTTIGS